MSAEQHPEPDPVERTGPAAAPAAPGDELTDSPEQDQALPGPDAAGSSGPTASPEQDQEELSSEELEQHIAEAEQLQRDLTARLDATAQD